MYSKRPFRVRAGLILSIAMACSRPVHAEDAGAAAKGAPFDRAAVGAAVARIAAELRAAYVFPEKGDRAAAAIEKAFAANAYDGVADASQFAKQITVDLQSMTSDDHIRVFYGLPSPGQAAPSPPNDAGFERVDRLKGNIGYIRLARFVPPAIFRGTADNAMRLVADTDALIIDVRGNGGGHPASAAYLSSFFLDPARPIHLDSFVVRNRGAADFRTEEFWSRPTLTRYLDKPVFVLVGPQTFSAAEGFAYSLQALGRVTVVGARTKGGATGNPSGLAAIGSNLFVNTPSGRAENPVTKGNWDHVGVLPDIQAAPDAALDAAMRLASAVRKPAAADRDAAASAGQTTASTLEDWLDAPLLKIRASPLAGGESAVRFLIRQALAERPDYEPMSPEVAERTRQKLPQLRAVLTALGAVRSVAFRRADAMGDTFSVEHEGGSSEWTIFVKNGKIESVIFPSPTPSAG